MFRAVPMMRLQALVLAQDERAVLKGIGRLGAVHLTSTPSGLDTAPLAPVDRTGELAQYNHIRARLQNLRQSLEIPPSSNEPMSAAMTMDKVQESLSSMEQRGSDLLEHRQRLMQGKKEAAATCERVSSFRGFEIPLNGPDHYSFLHFVTGSIPAQNLDHLGKEVGENVGLIPLAQEKGQRSLFAITTSQGWPLLERTLQKAGFQREMLPIVDGATVDSLSGEGKREQNRLGAELGHVNDELKTIAADFALPLAEIERFADTERRLLEASQKFPRTEATVLVAGWVPAGEIATLEQRMGEITGGRYALETTRPDTSTGEQIPVLLRHPRLLRPFEMLVSAYGLPKYQELEPTLFVALSYVLMFGMMFGDVGHGAVLATGGLIALLAGRTAKRRDLGVLLLFAGLSSIVFGVVYGSCFGLEPFKKYALWHDPWRAIRCA